MARKSHTAEKRFSAKMLFRRGFGMPEIMEELKLPSSTLYRWREKDAWDQEIPAGSVEETVARRICFLADKPQKTELEVQEFLGLVDKFGDFQLKLATARAKDRGESGRERGAGDNGEKGGRRKERKKAPKNDVSGITPEMLAKVREEIFFKFGYQKLWWDIKQDPVTGKNRFILKSRQIGATYYFAWEAFEDAVLTGDNQIFLSSSRDQAEVFKAYIIAFAQKFFDVELKGARYITLSNGAELRFVSTNASTAASYHGHLYVDEVFWIPNFQKVWDQASGMASHKKWRTTVFSVPSAKSHPAYRKWAGAEWNEGKPEHQHFTLDIDHDELHAKLRSGWLGPDRWWRHMVTVEDAEAQGCDLFDIEDLKAKNSQDAFENKYLCKFIDDARSAFSLALLLACGVEPGSWKDFNPHAARPFGNKPVAIGYDPSRTGDHAAIVVMAVPILPTDKWRVLERIDMRKVSYQYQANRIKELLERYNVVHIGVDVTGEGRGVYPYIEHIPCVVAISYNVNVKCDLVTKALDVVQPPPRLEFDVRDTGIVHSFLMIRKTITEGTSQITYTSARNTAQGHADVAWAMMHAMIHEPINPSRAKATVAFSN